MDSSENSRNLMGEIYAELEYPFIMLSGVLKEVHPWCDILSLHLNIKYCQAQTEKQHRELSLYIGRKTEQSLERASHVVLTFHADTKMPDYLQVNLNADMGPFDTRNYHISLEAIPVKERSIIHPPFLFL